jgi:hypothetical protein
MQFDKIIPSSADQQVAQYNTKVQLIKGGVSLVPPINPTDLVTKNYTDTLFSRYLPLNAIASDSYLLNGQPGSYYEDIPSRLGYTPENTANKGVSFGYAELDANGTIPLNRLPQEIFNVEQYPSKTYFPITGRQNVIYIAADTNFIYRWSAPDYVSVSGSSGSAEDALQLKFPRLINGTPFDGTADITTSYWGNSISITIGNTTLQVDGSQNLSWSVNDILGYVPVNKAGDSITGPLLLNNAPTVPLEASNKQYVDSVLTNAINVPVGGLVAYDVNAPTPPGFLICNGAILSVSQYSNLYSVIGHKYDIAGSIGGGVFWNQQYGINSNTASLTTLNAPTYSISYNLLYSVTTGDNYPVISFNNSTIYSICSTEVKFATISADGSLVNGFTSTVVLPTAISSNGLIIASDSRLFVYGCANNASYTASVNPDKTVNNFVSNGSLELPINYVYINTGSSVYLLGENTTLMSVLDSYGNVSSFGTVQSIPIGAGLAKASAANTSNFAYIVGININSTYKLAIADISSGIIGTWIFYDIPFSVDQGTSCTILNNTIYVNNYTDIYSATINPDGTVSNWVSVAKTPVSPYFSSTSVSKQSLYGINNNLILASVFYYYATVNPDTTVSSFKGYPYFPLLYSTILDPTKVTFFATKNKMYMVTDYIRPSTLFCSDVDQNGNAGGFYDTGKSVGTQSGLLGFSAIVANNFVYMLGGNNNSVYKAVVNPDGSVGDFNTIGSTYNSTTYCSVVCVGNILYCIGGRDGTSNAITNVVYCVINSDGSLTSWVNTQPLPSAMYDANILITGKYLYVFGGNGSSTSIYYTAINSDNSINMWNTGSGLPISMDKVGVYSTSNYVFSIVNGKLYKSPINADGTIGTWSVDSTLSYNINGVLLATGSNVYVFSKETIPNLYYPIGRTFNYSYIGGLNDYSAYYDPTYVQTHQTDTFRLPIAVSQFSSNVGYIIRY